MVLIIFFLLRKSFKRVQCSNESLFHSYMKFYVTQWSATRFRVRAAPFGDYCLYFSLPRRQPIFGVNNAFTVYGGAGTRDEPLRTSAWKVFILRQYP